MNIFTEKAK